MIYDMKLEIWERDCVSLTFSKNARIGSEVIRFATVYYDSDYEIISITPFDTKKFTMEDLVDILYDWKQIRKDLQDVGE